MEYEPWVTTKFGDVFESVKPKTAQSSHWPLLARRKGSELPSSKEAGNWLAVQNEGRYSFSPPVVCWFSFPSFWNHEGKAGGPLSDGSCDGQQGSGRGAV